MTGSDLIVAAPWIIFAVVLAIVCVFLFRSRRASRPARRKPAGGPPRYEGRVGDNHHHVVCRSCGAVADVDCAVGEAPCLTASEDHGFTIEEAQVIYWGLCPDCSTARSSWAP